MDLDHRVSGYREVAESLQNQIRTGQMSVGSLLPTERELVECFGVSRTTVRRALAYMVSIGWAESIPNRGVTAKIGRSESRRQVIGFVDHAGVFEPHLFFSLNAELQSMGLVLSHVDSAVLGTVGALEYCAEQRFAAAVVWSKTINPDATRIQRILQSMPVIAVDHSLRGIETDLVACDVFSGAKAAVRHLANLGRQRIAVTGMLDSLDTTQERFAGYLAGMFEAGLQPDPRDFLFTRTSGKLEPYTAALERRLADAKAPDAVFVMQDHAMPDLMRAVSRTGVSIPDGLAVVTMGSDEPFAALSQIGLTTVAFDWAQMAEILRDRVCRRLAEPSAPAIQVVVPAKLMVRGSCGASAGYWTELPPLPISSALRRQAGVRGSSPVSQESGTSSRPYRHIGGTSPSLSLSST